MRIRFLQQPLQVSGKIADVPLANCGCRQRDVVEIMVDAEFFRHKCHKEADALLMAQLRGLDHRRDGLMERAGRDRTDFGGREKYRGGSARSVEEFGPELRQGLIRCAGLFRAEEEGRDVSGQ